MSIEVMTLVFKCALPPVDKLIALCLADHAHDDGTHVFPSVAALAEKASMGTTAARSALRRLEQRRILIQISKGGGRGHPATYRFDLDELQNPTESVAFPNPTPEHHKANGETPQTQRLDDETQRVGVAESSEPSVNLETSRTVIAPASRTRARNPIYEILFFVETGLEYSTENRRALGQGKAKGKLDVATSEIKSMGVSPEELQQAIAAWPSVMGDALCTANAIATHLPRLRAAANGQIARQRENDYDRSLRHLREVDARGETADA